MEKTDIFNAEGKMGYRHSDVDPIMAERAGKLRKNMTPEEKKLWYEFLKHLPYTFNRQYVFERYIVDFYCEEKKLVIEIDGSQHYEEGNIRKDAIRTAFWKHSAAALFALPIGKFMKNLKPCVCRSKMYWTVFDGRAVGRELGVARLFTQARDSYTFSC